MKSTLLILILTTMFAFVPADAQNCCDVDGSNSCDIADIIHMYQDFVGRQPIPAGRGDVDHRQGINTGDLRYLFNYFFTWWAPPPACPPYPPYPLLTSSDTLIMPATSLPAGVTKVNLPVIMVNRNWVSDFLVSFKIRKPGGSMIADSLHRAGYVAIGDVLYTGRFAHWPDSTAAFCFSRWSNWMPPGTNLFGTVDMRCTSVPAGIVSLDTAKLGPNSFLNYVYASTDTAAWQQTTIGIPTVVTKHYPYPALASIMPSPQYTYYLQALTPVIDTIVLGDFINARSASQINLSSITINGLPATASEVVSQLDGYFDNVIRATIPASDLLAPLGLLYDTTYHPLRVNWSYTDGVVDSAAGTMAVIGHRSLQPGQFIAPPHEVVVAGDFDLSGSVDIGDAVAIIGYVFSGRIGPDNILIGDTDCTGSVDISDVVYLIHYIFSSGPAPCVSRS